MKISKAKKMYLVTVSGDISPDDNGNRLVTGNDVLGAYVHEKLEDFSSDSKETMRSILEQDETHVMEMFRGRVCLEIYSANERKRVSIRLVNKTVEA